MKKEKERKRERKKEREREEGREGGIDYTNVDYTNVAGNFGLKRCASKNAVRRCNKKSG